MKVRALLLLALAGCTQAPPPAPGPVAKTPDVDWSQYQPIDPPPPTTDGIDEANAAMKRREETREFARELAKEQAKADAAEQRQPQ